jgi:hypothetical protein
MYTPLEFFLFVDCSNGENHPPIAGKMPLVPVDAILKSGRVIIAGPTTIAMATRPRSGRQRSMRDRDRAAAGRSRSAELNTGHTFLKGRITAGD